MKFKFLIKMGKIKTIFIFLILCLGAMMDIFINVLIQHFAYVNAISNLIEAARFDKYKVREPQILEDTL